MKRFFAALLVVLSVFSLFAQDDVINIKDAYGRTVSVKAYPERVVSLAPSITEIVFALGKGKSLVGRTDYCDYPSEVKGIESVGSLMQPNLEKIAALRPDVVIAASHVTKEAVTKLEELGIPVAVLDYPQSFEGTYEAIIEVGKLLGAQQQADMIIDDIEQDILDVMSAIGDSNRPRVYYVVSYGQYGDYTAGKGTFIDTLINMAGGVNVASDVEGWQYSAEKLLEKDPDIIIVSKYWDTKKGFMSTAPYNQLTAVKKGNVIEIDNNLVDRQGPRIGKGLKELAKAIHPEAFE
ncbi:ABC transporter substrate-binding protein [Spirochaetia bacterium 38H-sp]|uniref:ABC transporter substrate-binding protein n=1 Tax=Rarispira pelagica TaxID=3141764 RepID=A0ABU9U8G7_9SPIR